MNNTIKAMLMALLALATLCEWTYNAGMTYRKEYHPMVMEWTKEAVVYTIAAAMWTYEHRKEYLVRMNYWRDTVSRQFVYA